MGRRRVPGPDRRGGAGGLSDRPTADPGRTATAYPGGWDAVRHVARTNRDFLGRAVRFMAGGLDVVDPGVVPVDEWRPDTPPEGDVAHDAAVARKP